MAATRRADVTWEGDLLSGSGVVSAGTSRSFTALPVSWASRTESAQGRTSPEELLAAAHASCFAMALSFGLAGAGKPPKKTEVRAAVTFANFTLVPGPSAHGFGALAASATALLVALVFLRRGLRDMEFRTFFRQRVRRFEAGRDHGAIG